MACLVAGPSTSVLIDIIFQMLTIKLSHRQIYKAGPFNAISRKITQYGVGVIRANKVLGIITTQLYSVKSETRFFARSNIAHGVL